MTWCASDQTVDAQSYGSSDRRDFEEETPIEDTIGIRSTPRQGGNESKLIGSCCEKSRENILSTVSRLGSRKQGGVVAKLSKR